MQNIQRQNVSKAVNMVLKGAKKRRSMVVLMVKSMNTDIGFKPNISIVK